MGIVKRAIEREERESPEGGASEGDASTGRGAVGVWSKARPANHGEGPLAALRGPVDLKATPAWLRLPASGADSLSERPPVELRRRDGLQMPARTRSLHANQFRTISAQLMAGIQRQGNAAGAAVILVTSAVQGEGKSSVALGIALSIACHSETTVLLVDADLQRRGLSVQLGVGGRRGLADVLVDPSIRIPEVVCATDVRRLHVLPAGTPGEASTELLAEEAAEQLLGGLGVSPGRVVVVDCGAVLESPAVPLLATCAGQVVLVVRASTTPRGAVAEALQSLADHPRVAMVLNKVGRRLGSGAWQGGTS